MTEPRWYNIHGEEVDLDRIDREYALNILLLLYNRRRHERVDPYTDPLIQKLRLRVLYGPKPGCLQRWGLWKFRFNRAAKKIGHPKARWL